MSKLRVHASPSRSTATAPARARSLKIRSASAARRCTDGSSRRARSRRLFGKDGGETGIDDDFAARGFENLGAWILGRNMFGPVARRRGRTTTGRAGGATTRPTTCRCSCSPTTRARRSRWRAAPPSTSSPTASRPRSRRRRRRRAARTCASAAASRRSAQYLHAGLIDEMHFAISPVLLGARRGAVRRLRPADARLRAHASTCRARRRRTWC